MLDLPLDLRRIPCRHPLQYVWRHGNNFGSFRRSKHTEHVRSFFEASPSELLAGLCWSTRRFWELFPLPLTTVAISLVNCYVCFTQQNKILSVCSLFWGVGSKIRSTHCACATILLSCDYKKLLRVRSDFQSGGASCTTVTSMYYMCLVPLSSVWCQLLSTTCSSGTT